MSINIKELRALSAEEKSRLVEFLRVDIALSETSVPDWALDEAQRRLTELEQNPELGVSREVMRGLLVAD